jgi:hypothetical protein
MIDGAHFVDADVCSLKGTRTGLAALEFVMIRGPIEGGRAGIVLCLFAVRT